MAILMFVVGVVMTECLVAYLLLPGPAQTEAMLTQTPPAAPSKRSEEKEKAQAKDKKEEKRAGEGKDKKEEKQEVPEQIEADMGEFSVAAIQPAANTTLRIAFHMYGIVASQDTAEFSARMKQCQHRFREQVIVTLRGAEVSDLTDAGLGLLKRTILEKTNAMLGKPLVKTVIFSDFSFMEL